MEFERDVLVSPTTEVPVIEGETVTAIRTLASRGIGKKAIAREVGVALNTVRRYLRHPITAGSQVRPAARRLTDGRRDERGRCTRGQPPAMRSSCSDCSRSTAARSAFAQSSERWPTSDARSASPRWRPFGWKPRRAIRCRSTSARSGCDCRHQCPDLSAGRRPQLLAPPLRQSVSQ